MKVAHMRLECIIMWGVDAGAKGNHTPICYKDQALFSREDIGKHSSHNEDTSFCPFGFSIWRLILRQSGKVG